MEGECTWAEEGEAECPPFGLLSPPNNEEDGIGVEGGVVSEFEGDPEDPEVEADDPGWGRVKANSCGKGSPKRKHKEVSTGEAGRESSTKMVFGVLLLLFPPETLLSKRRGRWRFLNSRVTSSSLSPRVIKDDKGSCPLCKVGGATQRSAFG